MYSSLCRTARCIFLVKHVLVENWKYTWYEVGCHQLDMMEALTRSSQQRRRVGYSGVQVGRNGRGDERELKNKEHGNVSKKPCWKMLNCLWRT